MADESGKLEPQELQQLTLRKQKPYLFPLARRARLYTPSPLRHEITRESYLPSTSDLDLSLGTQQGDVLSLRIVLTLSSVQC
jgi:hypothetical protein